MRFRFATWNVDAFRGIRGKVELVRQVDCHLLALQEVTPSTYNAFADSGIFSWSAFSLVLRPPALAEGRGRRLGCAIFGREPFRFKLAQLIQAAPLPERTLVVELACPVGSLTVCSFHAPPGVTWGILKPQTFEAIANWLADRRERTVFGMDANTPKTDHPDPESIEWHWADEPVLLGPVTRHNLRDALRIHLAHHPDMMEQIRMMRPLGPLAVSYDRGRRKGGSVPCRYDFVYVTPDIDVEDVQHLYHEAAAAGSDHALVVADLLMRPRTNDLE